MRKAATIMEPKQTKRSLLQRLIAINEDQSDIESDATDVALSNTEDEIENESDISELSSENEDEGPRNKRARLSSDTE